MFEISIVSVVGMIGEGMGLGNGKVVLVGAFLREEKKPKIKTNNPKTTREIITNVIFLAIFNL